MYIHQQQASQKEAIQAQVAASKPNPRSSPMPAQTSVTNQNRPTEKAGLQALRAAEHQSQKHPHPQLPIGFWVFPTSSGDSLTEPTRIPVTHPQPGDAVERPVRQVGVVAVIGKFFVGGGQGDCGEKILLAPVAEGYDDSERPRAAASASVSGHFTESFWVVFLIK
ncbi:hypothetical protein ACFX14_037723 [Malus domestica]